MLSLQPINQVGQFLPLVFIYLIKLESHLITFCFPVHFRPLDLDGTDFDGRVHIAGDPEAAEILARIEEASRSLP